MHLQGCIYNLKLHLELLEENKCLVPYTELNDYNKVFYYQRSTAMEDKIIKLLENSDTLLICVSRLSWRMAQGACVKRKTAGKDSLFSRTHQIRMLLTA